MCRLSRNPGALTSRTPQGHVDLFRGFFTFFLLAYYWGFMSYGLFFYIAELICPEVSRNVLPSHWRIDGSKKDFSDAEIVYKHWIISQLINLFNKGKRGSVDNRPNPPTAQQPAVDQGLLIIDASQLHSDTSQSIRLLWTSDRPDAETSTWQDNSHNRQTSITPVGFEAAVPAIEWPQTYALDPAATGINHRAQ
jgi:hypothetical protein